MAKYVYDRDSLTEMKLDKLYNKRLANLGHFTAK